jgi:hypothetical protein
MKTIGGQERTKFPRPRSRPLDLRLHGGGLQSRAVAQAPGASHMSASANGKLVGRWRIVEADIWDRDYLDLCRPATMTDLYALQQQMSRLQFAV